MVIHVKEKHRSRVFDNRETWKIFGHERNEVTGGCRGQRKLQGKELNNYQMKQDEMGRTGSTHGIKVIAYKILVGEVKRKKLFAEA